MLSKETLKKLDEHYTRTSANNGNRGGYSPYLKEAVARALEIDFNNIFLFAGKHRLCWQVPAVTNPLLP